MNRPSETRRRRIPALTLALVLALVLLPSVVRASPAIVGPAGPVLPPLATAAPVPSPGIVAERVSAALAQAGGPVGAVVFDAGSGSLLYDSDGLLPRTPASTIKILTALTALENLDPLGRIETTVTWDAAAATLVLTGSGDPTLSTASGEGSSLSELADEVVAATGGPVPGTSVTLLYDTSLFTGPELGPGWSADYPVLGVAAPVSALVVDGARIPGSASFQADPALAAARAFADQLRARGIGVNEPREGVIASGQVIATTVSVPVADMVQRMLTASDNNMAESLAHLAGAERSGTGSFASGGEAVLATLADMGVSASGVIVADGSGLSQDNKVAPRTLGEVLIAVDRPGALPWVWPVPAGLPVAGFTGTLADRFRFPPADAGAGLVRAKTGTLSGVTSLSGTVVDASGRLLVFAFLAEPVPDTFAARAALDAAAAELARCGCAASSDAS